MELTKNQKIGLDTAIHRFRNREKYTVIGGYAGTGKSTLVKYIIAALGSEGVDPEFDVAYCAYTGKAASVLAQKGCPNATTAHKLMYKAKPTKDGKFIYQRKLMLEYKVIVVDECSMLPKFMMDNLLSYQGIYVIFCGDPGQIPPIDKNANNHLLDTPHVFLDEIMRQAADSGIIQLSMKIRNGESIDGFKTDDAIVIPKSQLNTGMLQWGDIVLCATNATRNSINSQIRNLQGYEQPIVENEKVICLKNEWETISDCGNALTNGCIGYLHNIFDTFQAYPPMFKVYNNRINLIGADFESEYGDKFDKLSIDKKCLITGETSLTPQQKYNIGRNKRFQDTIPFEFTYGYTITGHRAQGSQWSKVLVIEEKFPFDKEEHRRWLYTCVTRGESKVVLVR